LNATKQYRKYRLRTKLDSYVELVRFKRISEPIPKFFVESPQAQLSAHEHFCLAFVEKQPFAIWALFDVHPDQLGSNHCHAALGANEIVSRRIH